MKKSFKELIQNADTQGIKLTTDTWAEYMDMDPNGYYEEEDFQTHVNIVVVNLSVCMQKH